MLVIGLILVLGGLGSLIYGFMQNNSLEAQVASFLSSGTTNPGTMFIVIGVVAVLLGIVLMIISRRRKA